MAESPPSVASPRIKDSDPKHRDDSRKRKAVPKRTQQVRVSPGVGLEGPLDDGYSWRKYGEKEFLNAKYRRGYYMCTYRNVQGCPARKKVQRSDEDPTVFEITYRGRHTCAQASHINPPPTSPEKQEQNNKHQPPQNQQPSQDDQIQMLLNFQTTLKVKTENLDTQGQGDVAVTSPHQLGRRSEMEEERSADGLKDQEGSTMVSSPSVPSKRTRVLSGTQKFSCLVDGCKADLNMCRGYHRRHRVCERHSKVPVVIVGGIEQRFCQQCSRFHSLGEFDEWKRSCRKRLNEHSMRRRKPQPLSPSFKQFVSNYKESIPKAFFAEEGIEKRITESQGEVLGVEAFEMKSNSGEKHEEIEDTFPLHHLFKKERFADTEDDKIFHTCSFADPSDLTVDPVQQWEGSSTEPIPHFPAEEGIEKRITSESQRMVFEVEAIEMKSNSGEKIGVEFEAFGQDKIEEIGIEPETSDMDWKTLSMGLEICSYTIIQREVLQSCLVGWFRIN